MRLFLFTAVSLLLASPALADDQLTSQQIEQFEVHVRPVLVEHCIKCHGDTKQEGALRLTKLEELLRGGDSGPAIVPGKPDESLIMEALRYESYEMPPEGPLSDKQIKGIEDWIAAGAPWPKLSVLRPQSGITEEDRDWWCIQPVRDPEVPDVSDDGWCKNEIDRFIYARLAQAGIKPSEPADPRTLTRRLHFALTGLPPANDSPSALEASRAGESSWTPPAELIEQLLETPEYGENQAKFWLDLVRYADSDGYNADHVRPEAAKYRDYVIRSFNQDKPYDRFVMEQIAGDEIDPGNRDAIIATMYLRHWIYEWNQRDVEGQWAEILSDVTETTSDVFLAMSMKCAKCHDHKFDPLLQKDYYEMLSFFAPLQPREEMPLADLAKRTEHYHKQLEWEAATEDIRKQLHEIENPVLLKNSTREGVDKFVTEIKQMISKREGERSPYEHQIASMAARQFDVHPEKLPELLSEEQEAKRQELIKQLAEFDAIKPEPLPTVKFVASDVGPTAPPTLIPDVADQPPVQPGFPDVISDQPAEITSPPEALQSTGRRTALAQWLTDAENPLTARVIVNRIWAQHFGRGLVPTVNDFGHLGQQPSHPELLDWLTTRFIEDGWSIKKLHRRILSSATWQQSSLRPLTDELKQIDPTNTLLWRMNSRRLSAEEIVDSMLVASGELEKEKRAIYRQVRRNKPDPQLGLFDFPGRIRSAGERHKTTTPTQALMLLNNTWSNDRASEMFNRLSSKSDDALVRSAYRQLFYREATEQELTGARHFIAAYTEASPPSKPQKLVAALDEQRLGIDLVPEAKTSVQVPYFDGLPKEDFTIEAVVMLRSLYPDASVRTIVTQWTGNTKENGWALGVTSTKSGYKPLNLIMQVVGKTESGEVAYEVVPSNLRLELNKPFYVAVSVDLDNVTSEGITFYLKDLSTEDAELQTASVAHKAIEDISPARPIEIGSRSGNQQWDGVVQRLRLHQNALSQQAIETNDNTSLLFEIDFSEEEQFGRDVSGQDRHVVIKTKSGEIRTPEQKAKIALLHALMNSNELIYLD